MFGAKGGSHDGRKGRYNQDQCQVRENNEKTFCPTGHIGGNNFADGLAFMPYGREQGAEVMDAAEEDTADQNPQGHGQPAEHSRADRACNRTCAGNGRKMMPHQYGCFSGNIVDAVFQRMGRCRDVPFPYAPLFDQPAFPYAPLFDQPAAIHDVAAEQHSNGDEK